MLQKFPKKKWYERDVHLAVAVMTVVEENQLIDAEESVTNAVTVTVTDDASAATVAVIRGLEEERLSGSLSEQLNNQTDSVHSGPSHGSKTWRGAMRDWREQKVRRSTRCGAEAVARNVWFFEM